MSTQGSYVGFIPFRPQWERLQVCPEYSFAGASFRRPALSPAGRGISREPFQPDLRHRDPKTGKSVLASCLVVGYSLCAMSIWALTEWLGQPVFDPAGGQCGRVRELAVAPQEDRARVAVL